MCTDERTCRQLREHLQSEGSDKVMKRKLQEYFTWKNNFQKSRTELFEKKPEIAKEDGTLLINAADFRCCGGSTIENEEERSPTK
jgi:hypothetical protein